MTPNPELVRSMGYDPNEPPRMKCGHSANASHQTEEGAKPVCLICAGIVPGAYEVDEDPPSLEGRMMVCRYHRKDQVPSNPNAAFFGHRPDQDVDEYYCGCKGWD